MNEYTNICSGKELIVRKKISSFIEKFLRYKNYDFDHDNFKKIIYFEKQIKTPLEEKIKNYYDGYLYLLNNYMNPLTKEILNKFLFIIKGKLFDQAIIIRTINNYFNLISELSINNCIDFHLKIYNEFIFLDAEERTIISLMIFNFMLLKNNIPIIKLKKRDYIMYEKNKELYFLGNKTKMYSYIDSILKKAKFQNKNYYKNLTELNLQQIQSRMIEDKDILKNYYNIEKISIVGSFAKGLNRIDSDIDFLIKFNESIKDDEKLNIKNDLENHYLKVFKRYVDFLEVGKYVNDSFVKEFQEIKRIF